MQVGHLVFTSRVASKDVTAYLCDVDLSDSTYAIFYTQYWPYIHNVFLVVAFTVIIIGNVIITVHVKRSEDMGEMSKNSRRRERRQDHVKEPAAVADAHRRLGHHRRLHSSLLPSSSSSTKLSLSSRKARKATGKAV